MPDGSIMPGTHDFGVSRLIIFIIEKIRNLNYYLEKRSQGV